MKLAAQSGTVTLPTRTGLTRFLEEGECSEAEPPFAHVFDVSRSNFTESNPSNPQTPF
jgi:hypothetical protein